MAGRANRSLEVNLLGGRGIVGLSFAVGVAGHMTITTFFEVSIVLDCVNYWDDRKNHLVSQNDDLIRNRTSRSEVSPRKQASIYPKRKIRKIRKKKKEKPVEISTGFVKLLLTRNSSLTSWEKIKTNQLENQLENHGVGFCEA
jgi:hypothetical protein